MLQVPICQFFVWFKRKTLFEELILGDSRKYTYHTTGGILEFRGRGGVSWTGIPKTWGVTQFGISKAWGGEGVSALNSVNFQRKDGESSA